MATSPSIGSLSKTLGALPGQPFSDCPIPLRALAFHMYELAAKLAVAKRNAARRKREKGVILAHADIIARIIIVPR